MQQFTPETISTLFDLPEETAIKIMVEDEIFSLQSPYWLIACEAPDSHVYLFTLIQWGVKEFACWLSKYPQEDKDCQVFVSSIDRDKGYQLVGFTVSLGTTPPQVIFYTE
jgi:hypothetical protein